MGSVESNPLNLSLVLAILSLIPFLFVVTTAFLKISVVLMIVRNALGVQQVPPNMVIYGISLTITLFIMAPVMNDTIKQVTESELSITNIEELKQETETIMQPMKIFMEKFANAKIKEGLQIAATELWKGSDLEASNDSILIVIPSFVLSELERAFKIGFIVYIPFIVIDLIVSNLLLALGMQMVSPMTISLPLKILLFVVVEGWTQLLNNLIYSYL